MRGDARRGGEGRQHQAPAHGAGVARQNFSCLNRAGTIELFVWPGLRHATPYTEVESNTRGRAFITHLCMLQYEYMQYEYVFSSRHRVLHLIIGGRIRYGSKEVALL